LSIGASYGDDAEMDTNYPIIRITNSGGTVKYGKSFNWTPGVATGNTPVTTQFTMPAGFGPGQYTLNVIANGIASANFALNILAPPTIVSATADSTTSASVTWTSVTGADLGYQIYLKQGNVSTLVGTALAGATSGEATNLISGATNTIFVRALSSTYLPGQADSATFNVAIPAGLQAPQGVTAIPLSATTARVTWSPVTGADLGYQVFQVQGNKLVGSVGAGINMVVATGLTPGTTDALFVRALSSTLTPFSRDSNDVFVTMPTAVGVPVLSATVDSLTTATLNWTAAIGADGYRVYERIGTQIFLVGILGPTVTTMKLTGLTHGQKVQFMVEAYHGFVFSDSNWVDVLT
jgi:hypothetical protein